MATHSNTDWRGPWTEEPGGPQCMGSQSRTRLYTAITTAATATTTAIAVADVSTLCWVVKPELSRRHADVPCDPPAHSLNKLMLCDCCVVCQLLVHGVGSGSWPQLPYSHPTSVQLSPPFSSHIFDFWTPFQ